MHACSLGCFKENESAHHVVVREPQGRDIVGGTVVTREIVSEGIEDDDGGPERSGS